MDDPCEFDLSDLQLFVCQERLNGEKYEDFIADHQELQNHRDVSRFVKRTSLGYPAPLDSKGGRPLYLCEQDTEELIHQLNDGMQNIIPLSVFNEIQCLLGSSREEIRCRWGTARKNVGPSVRRRSA
jgi:hypothetical protein